MEQTTATYKIMRGWRDGESMQPHPIQTIDAAATVTNVEFADLRDACRFVDINGGYVERAADGAIWVGEWINGETGESVVEISHV